MKVEITIFGQLKEVLGSDRIYLENIGDSDQLSESLYENYPQLNDFSFRIAIDKNIIVSKTPISSSTIVALLPPFSGG